MNDSDLLRDAFRGFEDHADRVSETRTEVSDATRAGRPARRQFLLVAAAVVAVAAIATAVALVGAGGGSSRPHSGGAAGRPSATSADATPSTSASPSLPEATSSAPARTLTTPVANPSKHVPANRREMIAAFKRVLGNTATFTVTASYGNDIIGILTAHGRKGGFDIQAYDGKPGDKAICEDADTSHCVVRKTSTGGSLSTGHEPEGAGLLYLVNYVRPDGATYLMHLSTRENPKGAGKNFGTTPPLSIKQMVAILESGRWN